MRWLATCIPDGGSRVILTSIRRLVNVPAPSLYLELLESSTQSKSLNEGRKIHQHLLKNSPISSAHPLILDKLTCLYIACGRMDLAHKAFVQIPEPSVVLWNLMIRSYAWNGPFDYALDLYRQMFGLQIVPTKFTFPFVLKACSGLSAWDDGERIHCHVVKHGLTSDVYVATALLDLYAKYGCLTEAHMVFDRMDDRDVVAWNAMVAGFSLHGLFDEAVRLVKEMQVAGLSPNSSTIVGILPAVAEACALREGKAIHGFCTRRSFDQSVVVDTSLLDMYGKCGCISYARTIFELSRVRNEVTWSSMIGAFVLYGHMKEAMELFDRLLVWEAENMSVVVLGCVLQACSKLMDLSRGRRVHSHAFKLAFIDDIMLGNTILSMYAKCGALDDAVSVFNGMNRRDRVSYSAMISGFVQNGASQQALHFFQFMQSCGVSTDEATMLGVLPACSHLSAFRNGTCAHGYSIVCGFVDEILISNALIDMYAKCGKVKTAREIFRRMPDRDIVSWNSMIAGYGSHGLGFDALALFQELIREGLKPDEVTFISLLIACSHSGLVKEGKHWFDAMSQEFGIVPKIDHYICMVDLLGRAGLLEEANNFIEKLPFQPTVHIWGALLAACRVHKNVELAEVASSKIQNLGPEGTGNFVLLSNIYSSAGRWADAAHVRIIQKDKGFKKSPGCSWIEINGYIHAFIGGDQSHPRSEEIYKKLDELISEIQKLGYQAVPSFVLQDVEEEEKEHILMHHSEKLAIALGLISLSPGKPILVTKNLRVCGDCHEAIKFIALVAETEITVRDTARFHHFKNGTCSCGDYW